MGLDPESPNYFQAHALLEQSEGNLKLGSSSSLVLLTNRDTWYLAAQTQNTPVEILHPVL